MSINASTGVITVNQYTELQICADVHAANRRSPDSDIAFDIPVLPAYRRYRAFRPANTITALGTASIPLCT
jgi:hypothetical protein